MEAFEFQTIVQDGQIIDRMEIVNIFARNIKK